MIECPALIAGARPNFVKIAALVRALDARGMAAPIVHTGQHYDHVMSGGFFDALGIPAPSVNLGVGSGSHASQTANVMLGFERWLETAEVDAVLVVGDVNSTLACSLVAAKAQLPIGHVEAGLRAFDRTMPEEINRVVVDSLATWLFTPSADADVNLLAEGVEPSRIFRVGNVMVDSLMWSIGRAPQPSGLVPGVDRYGLVTLHRPALVDDADRLREMMVTLHEVADAVPLVFPVHPRTRRLLEDDGVRIEPDRIRLREPLGYLDFLSLEAGAAVVITDSGGVQEETTALGVPCITVRDNTERPVTITRGTNRLVGFDRERILDAVADALAGARTPSPIPGWDGSAACRIVDVLCSPPPTARFVPPALSRHPSPEHRAATIEPRPHLVVT